MTDSNTAEMARTRATLNFARKHGFAGMRYVGLDHVQDVTNLRHPPEIGENPTHLPFSELDIVRAGKVKGSCLVFMPHKLSMQRISDLFQGRAKSRLPLCLDEVLSVTDPVRDERSLGGWFIDMPLPHPPHALPEKGHYSWTAQRALDALARADDPKGGFVERVRKEPLILIPTLAQALWCFVMMYRIHNVQLQTWVLTSSRSEAGTGITVGPFTDEGIIIHNGHDPALVACDPVAALSTSLSGPEIF